MSGLIGPGDRKSVEPMAARLAPIATDISFVSWLPIFTHGWQGTN